MLKEMKRTVLRVMQNTGLFKILSESGWRTDRLLILGYHGISQDDEHIWNPELYMSPEQFQSHLEMIRDQGFTVLDLDEDAAVGVAEPADARVRRHARSGLIARR